MVPIISVIQDSFQEYDNEHSLVLFTKGCNLNCVGCYNLEYMDAKAVGNGKELVDKYITPLHTAVVILGGEPTIHKDSLINLCKYIRQKNLKVKLFTNGMKPVVVNCLLNKDLLDAISIDFKGVKNLSNILGIANVEGYLEKFQLTVNICKRFDIDIEIRTTLFPVVRKQKELIKTYLVFYCKSIKHIWQEPYKEKEFK